MRLHTHLSSWHRLFKHLNHNQPLLFTPNFWSSIAQGRHFLTIAFCSSRRHHIFQWEELLIDLSSPTPPVSCWRQIGCMLLKNGTQTQTKRLCKAVIDVNVCIFYVLISIPETSYLVKSHQKLIFVQMPTPPNSKSASNLRSQDLRESPQKITPVFIENWSLILKRFVGVLLGMHPFNKLWPL